MALPATITGFTRGTASPNNLGHMGPFKASDGDLFVVGLDANIVPADEVEVYRSPDGGNTWGSAVQTTRESSGPPNADTILSVDVNPDGDTLRVVWTTGNWADGMTTRFDVEYQEFNMATNSWSGSIDVVDSPAINTMLTARKYASVASRTSDVVIFYRGDDGASMGNDFIRVAYARGTAGSWGTTGQDPRSTAQSGEVHFYASGGVIVGSVAGDCHFVWLGASSDGEASTLRADNTVSTFVTHADFGSLDNTSRTTTTWAGASQQKIIAHQANTKTYRLEEDGSNDIALDRLLEQTHNNVAIAPRSYSYDPDNDELYAVFEELVDDLWYNFATDPDSDTDVSWGAGFEQQAATLGLVSTEFYTHSSGNGGDGVIGILYDDDGTWKYDEIVVTAGAAPIYPPFPRRQLTTVRM